jgi:hypothetical protein
MLHDEQIEWLMDDCDDVYAKSCPLLIRWSGTDPSTFT